MPEPAFSHHPHQTVHIGHCPLTQGEVMLVLEHHTMYALAYSVSQGAFVPLDPGTLDRNHRLRIIALISSALEHGRIKLPVRWRSDDSPTPTAFSQQQEAWTEQMLKPFFGFPANAFVSTTMDSINGHLLNAAMEHAAEHWSARQRRAPMPDKIRIVDLSMFVSASL